MVCSHIHRFLIVRTPYAYFCRCLALACAILIPGTCWAVDINAGFNTAADQPKINASLSRDGTTALISPDGFDPNNPLTPKDTINFQPFLDTGTSGILLSKETATSFGIQNLKVGGTDVVFSDVAVGGTFNTNVSESIYVRLARFNETVDAEDTNQYTQTSGPLNAQVAVATNPFGAVDIVGMPAMAGKVLVMDSGDLNNAFALAQAGDPSLLFGEVSLRTYIYNPGQAFVGGTSNPGIPPAIFTSSSPVPISAASPR